MAIKIINTKRHALVVVVKNDEHGLMRVDLYGTMPKPAAPRVLRHVAETFERSLVNRRYRPSIPAILNTDGMTR